MNNNKYLALVIKQLSGELSPQEAIELRDWLAQSPRNERLAKEFELVWKKSEGYEKSFSPNLDQAFAQVQSRIQTDVPAPMRVVSFGQKMLRAAAAIAVLACAVWGYQSFNAADRFDSFASVQQEAKQQVDLSDGTKVWLRKGSTLQYAAAYEGQTERHVRLTGEGYFEVAHDPEHPFKVELSNGASVEVLGTEFNIKETEINTTVLVRSGKVRFSPDGKTQSPVLTANQKAVFDKSKAELRVSTANTLNDLAWQTGGLEFVKTPLSQVMADLEKFYQVKISLNNQTIATCPHTAPLTNAPLTQVLEALALTYQLKVKEVETGVYELTGGICVE